MIFFYFKNNTTVNDSRIVQYLLHTKRWNILTPVCHYEPYASCIPVWEEFTSPKTSLHGFLTDALKKIRINLPSPTPFLSQNLSMDLTWLLTLKRHWRSSRDRRQPTRIYDIKTLLSYVGLTCTRPMVSRKKIHVNRPVTSVTWQKDGGLQGVKYPSSGSIKKNLTNAKLLIFCLFMYTLFIQKFQGDFSICNHKRYWFPN